MFFTDDVQADYERMKARGAEFTMPPTDVTASKIAMVNDTCGNLIQLTQLKPVISVTQAACKLLQEVRAFLPASSKVLPYELNQVERSDGAATDSHLCSKVSSGPTFAQLCRDFN